MAQIQIRQNSAQTENFSLDQGSDVSIDLYLDNADSTPKNLAGFGVQGTIKTHLDAVDSDDITIFSYTLVDPINGQVSLSLSSTQTANLSSRRRYIYDVELMHTDLDSGLLMYERILQGIITVVPSVTN
jgi:hypothetical protein